MRHTIENEFLTVTVETKGAELVSVVDKATGAEMMWDGQKDVWPRRAPILFPYCGKLSGGHYTLDGQTWEGGQHGFGRDFEHEFVGAENGAMRFVLRANEETRKKLPRDFALESAFVLDGRTLRQTITVTNTGDRELRFGFGFHPGFALPFDDKHTTADYELRFDAPQTPVVIETGATSGLVTGETRVMMENSDVIALDDPDVRPRLHLHEPADRQDPERGGEGHRPPHHRWSGGLCLHPDLERARQPEPALCVHRALAQPAGHRDLRRRLERKALRRGAGRRRELEHHPGNDL